MSNQGRFGRPWSHIGQVIIHTVMPAPLISIICSIIVVYNSATYPYLTAEEARARWSLLSIEVSSAARGTAKKAKNRGSYPCSKGVMDSSPIQHKRERLGYSK